MSRSYRKPYITQKNKKWAKQRAAKKVRKAADMGNNSYYKKIYESWDINEFRLYYPKDEKICRT